jgi:hypothetical protein
MAIVDPILIKTNKKIILEANVNIIKLYKYQTTKKPGQSAKDYHKIKRTHWYIQQMINKHEEEINNNYLDDLFTVLKELDGPIEDRPAVTMEMNQYVSYWSSV